MASDFIFLFLSFSFCEVVGLKGQTGSWRDKTETALSNPDYRDPQDKSVEESAFFMRARDFPSSV